MQRLYLNQQIEQNEQNEHFSSSSLILQASLNTPKGVEARGKDPTPLIKVAQIGILCVVRKRRRMFLAPLMSLSNIIPQVGHWYVLDFPTS